MYAINDYFADFNKSTVDQATKLANATFVGFEQLLNLNLSAAKTAFEVNTRNLKALSEITDVQDLVAFRAKVTESPGRPDTTRDWPFIDLFSKWSVSCFAREEVVPVPLSERDWRPLS